MKHEGIIVPGLERVKNPHIWQTKTVLGKVSDTTSKIRLVLILKIGLHN